MLYERAQKEYQHLQTQKELLQKQINECPPGKLVCCQTPTQRKWYQSNGHQKTYIPRKNRKLAESLALKKYLTYLLQDISHELTALNLYLKHHQPMYQKAHKLLTDNPAYKELLAPSVNIDYSELSQWQTESFIQNPYHPEKLLYKTPAGHSTRSKSEALIATFLFTQKIPYRYECLLQLGATPVYPDFTIRHPKTGEFFYWEHFGLMDDDSYRQNAFNKLQQYGNHQIYPSIQLITTYETQNNPLDTEYVMELIKYYFL